jgi:phage portal protein BeeE
LEAGLKWLNLGYSPAETDWSGLLKMSTIDICKVFNVAPEIVGDSANKTYSNYQEARQSLYVEVVLPLLDFICDELNNWLAPLYPGDLLIGYDRSKIEALKEDADELWTRLNSSWEISPNERRTAKGFDALPDPAMDAIYIPANLVPLDMLSIDPLGEDEEPGAGKTPPTKKPTPKDEEE